MTQRDASFGANLRASPDAAVHKARDAWFRSSDWDARARAEFARRIARARPDNRVQYRRIKALALHGSGDRERAAAGYEMMAAIAGDPEAPRFEKVGALSALGAYDQDRGHLDDAERSLRSALKAMDNNPSGSTGLEGVCLAEVLLARGGRGRLEEARGLLESSADDPPVLLDDRFRMCVSAVRVSLALGGHAQAAAWANTALSLANASHSGLANHPTLGLVQVDAKTREWLASVAGRPR